MIDREHGWLVSFKPSSIGFVLSLLLTMGTYHFVLKHHLSGAALTLCILGLAMLQALVQFFFFLHVGMETKPRWSLVAFLFMILIMVVIVGGSMWIMSNLDYNTMPNMEMGSF